MPYADPQAQRDYQRRWANQRRASFFVGKHCSWCDAREDLELHHRDPSRKVSHKIWSWGEKRRQAELDKCVVLCSSCHKRAHREARRLEAELRNPHGTVNRYKLGCHCEPCTAANRDCQRERKQAA